MRDAFVRALVGLAEEDDRVMLLTGDLGFSALEPFSDRFGDRFVNVGVAEQNMVGIATGLAASGMVPFVYSIATFASMRPYEFTRNGPLLHGLPVRVVGVGGGVDYGHNGPTHHALEDVALMRCQPAMTLLAPADADQTEAAVHLTSEVSGPVYLRLQRTGRPVAGLDGRLALGRLAEIGDGTDVAIVTYGGIAADAVAAAELLREEGIEATVAIAASLAPAPTDELERLLSRCRVAVTVEEHYPNGGLGSLVSEVVAERGIGRRVVRVAVGRTSVGDSGSAAYIRGRLGLDPAGIANAVREAVAADRGVAGDAVR